MAFITHSYIQKYLIIDREFIATAKTTNTGMKTYKQIQTRTL